MVAPLRSFLLSRDFITRLSVIEERTRDLLQFWQAHAPHYTDHGKTHCEAVEKNLDELIPDNIKTSMNEYEIFLLLLGVSLHDIGIMYAAASDEENQTIRETHHERSKQYVLNKLKETLNGSERYVVGEICFAHRDLVHLEQIEKTKTIRHSSLGNMDVRVQFLAGLLRLSDACDVCHSRTQEELTSVIKPPRESGFFHALHERVSGIRFDTEEKALYIDFNIASPEEKDICKEYLADNIQKTLNSVRDCLTRNNVIYISVESKFSTTNTLTSKLDKPQPREVRKPKPLPEMEKMLMKARLLSEKRSYKKSLRILEKLRKRYSTSAVLWWFLGDVYYESGNMKESLGAYQRCLKLDPKNPAHLSNIGHVYGEYLLDFRKSFESFEKAYELSPRHSLYALNYAEALVTVGKTQEGYNIANKYLQEGNVLENVLNAYFIKAYSLCFLGKISEGLKQLKVLIMFFESCPPSINKTNTWSYNKIRKYIRESKLERKCKRALLDTIDMLELKSPIEDFMKRHRESL